MHQTSEMLVPYDNESCLLAAKFSKDILAVGFGSFSDRKDGAIAMWKMSELLSSDITEEQLTIWTVPGMYFILKNHIYVGIPNSFAHLLISALLVGISKN